MRLLPAGGLRPLHARRAHRADAAFTWLLWIGVAVTIGVLVLIVLYIVFRGLVSDNLVDSKFLPAESTSLSTPGGGRLSIVVNARVRITSLTALGLEGIFNGDVGSWGDLSGQDIPPVVVLPDRAQTLEQARHVLLGGSSTWAPDAVRAAPSVLLKTIAETEGAIGVLPSADLPPAGVKGVRTVPIQELIAIVNSSVLALSEGRRMAAVSEAQMRSLLQGEVTNWRDLGGPDLPVRLASRSTATGGGLAAAVLATPGSIAACPWREAGALRDSVLEVRMHVVKRNLTLAYLYEAPRRAGKVGGVSTIILNTVLMILLTLLFTTPIGVGAALSLTEYTRQGKLVAILRFGTDTLAGIPSIIFGLFGFIVFVTILRMGIGLLSGTLTITIMLLPTIVRTSEEALRSVPASLREGSLALGATKWQTTTRVVVPAAIPGILTGVILAVGRSVGETAALLFTMGTDYRLVQGLRSSARVLSVHLFYLLKEGISFDKAFATGTILVIIVLIVNLVTTRLIGRMNLLRASGNRNARPA